MLKKSVKENVPKLEPIIKWAGGKEKELSFIIPNLPQIIDNYYEPFVGGGSVFVNMTATKYYINDKSNELIDLYKNIAIKDKKFFDWINLIAVSWKTMKNFHNIKNDIAKKYKSIRKGELSLDGFDKYIKKIVVNYDKKFSDVLDKKIKWKRNVLLKELEKNIISKTHRMTKIEKEKGYLSDEDLFDNIETSFMSALYMYYRELYNDEKIKEEKELATALFVFIRNYAYSGMFRYNNKGDFNVPYGGIAYNKKDLYKKINYYESNSLNNLLNKTLIYCLDFEEFLEKNKPKKNDFIFLDPPYDTEFSTYSQNEFGKEDQKRLANYMCNKCNANWMMIIKNTPYIYSLYNNKGLSIQKFEKNYTVSFMNRNDKKAEHLLITNY